MEKEQIVALVENTVRATAAALTVKNAQSELTENYKGVKITFYKGASGYFYYELSGKGFSRFRSSQVFYSVQAAGEHAKQTVNALD